MPFFAVFFGAFFAADFVAGFSDSGFVLAMISERRVLAFSSSAWRSCDRFLPARLM
ncbi:hypothetical protein RBB78_20520 [Tunturiibacter empetritectus]|uniref:hypothetical protein n=1 Tax=Tunturiibacter empetritectus TaxID=3069691 RepID=UPI003D9B3975